MQRLEVSRFSRLSHKAAMSSTGGSAMLPSWVPAEDRERLNAYLIRSAYLNNVARQALPASTTDKDRAAHREYGDASVLVDRIVAGVLGQDWTLTVDGADQDPRSDGPKLPHKPDAPAPVDDEAAQALIDAAHEEQLADWRVQVGSAIDRWRQAATSQPLLQARQDAVRLWADRVHFAARVNEFEQSTAGLGDGVFVLWPSGNDWPALTAHDPGFYFPEATDEGQDFPDRVHLAWEIHEEVAGVTKRRLRRLTFELVDLTELRSGTDSSGAPAWLDRDGAVALVPELDSTERFDTDGQIRRRQPWDPTGAPVSDWSTRTCLFSDGTWDLDNLNPSGLADLSDGAATWTHRHLDLRVDFIPVIHCPNTSAVGEVWGTAAVDSVAQILDDLATNDTDAMKASRYLSDPTIAVSGTSGTAPEINMPGMVHQLGEGGRMDVLDLATGLEKLMAAGDRLQDRYWQNSAIPAEILGRADAQAIAGITLALRYAPFAQLVGVLRMTREPKYRLVTKFAQRMAQAAQALEPGPTPEVRLSFGSFMPTNRAETVDIVTSALNAHAISTRTAVAMLVAAGLPIDDAAAEVERIYAEDTTGAREVADATGSEQLAADRLGLTIPALGGRPSPVLNLPAVDADL